MIWIHRTATIRISPGVRFPWAKTAVAFALFYDHPPARKTGILPWISGYVYGRSYHRVMRKRLVRAERILREYGSKNTYISVDTGPLSERELARGAGLGWMGKNGLLIHPRYGSYLFLGIILADLAIEYDLPVTDHCGSCQRCLEACPTRAFVAPRILDSRRCISYLTIEHRGEFTPPYHSPLYGYLHGCDLCQEVCPFVQRARREKLRGDPEFEPWLRWQELSPEEILRWDETRWDAMTRGSDLRRGGLQRLKRLVLRHFKEKR
jgi:epoxyqueuosine reductase